ncbi:MAG TPA: winged helix DNA-binding domain-containing protein [Flavobacterium sp.]|nr:winged helix DNA-binding domain-containing protein [Flavobacterium sp.]
MIADIANTRLYTQHLAAPEFKTAKEVVSYFGAMQAQDYPMAKWAIGVRTSKATDELVEQAIDKGDIFRTHLMRPTWHFVAAEDIHWMLELTGKNVMRQMGSSNRLLELDEKTFNKSNDKIREALEGNKHLTREELMEVLQHSGINTHSYRNLHLMLHAELSGIVCSGKRRGKNHTYALLDERVKKTRHYTKDAALAELAKRYFSSHGPATLKDFIWWSGLSVADAKEAIALNEKHFIKEESESQIYWISDSHKGKISNQKTVLLLPSFDEFLIAYKDRSASIHKDFSNHAFTNNGIFKPIIVVNGQVIGTWKRTIKKDTIFIETKFIQKTDKAIHKEITVQARRYGDFMEKKIELVF